MMTRTLSNPTFEVYAELRQSALAFLHHHALIPDMLYIAADGHIEAVYDYMPGKEDDLTAWQLLAGNDFVTLTGEPEIDRGHLRVQFKLNDPEQPSIWQRIKRIIA